MNIQIKTHDRKSPVEIKFGPRVATRSQIIEAELAMERWLEEGRELRAMMAKLNDASPIKIKHDSYFDDALNFGADVLSDIKGLPDALWEQAEGDR